MLNIRSVTAPMKANVSERSILENRAYLEPAISIIICISKLFFLLEYARTRNIILYSILIFSLFLKKKIYHFSLIVLITFCSSSTVIYEVGVDRFTEFKDSKNFYLKLKSVDWQSSMGPNIKMILKVLVSIGK